LGFVVVNFIHHSEDLFHRVEQVEEPIFGLFFALAGAHLDVSLLMITGGLAALLTLARFFGKLAGTQLGARITRAPKVVRRYLGIGLLPQAGVTIGLILHARGQLIGINTAIFSQEVGAQGIGFAIPISIALDIKQQIIDNGKVSRGWIGVEGTQITAKAAMETGNPNIRGALIVGVFIDSPADIAGIRSGDIMVAVNGEPVDNIGDLLEVVTLYQPGEIIETTVFRGHEQLTFSMRATERPQ